MKSAKPSSPQKPVILEELNLLDPSSNSRSFSEVWTFNRFGNNTYGGVIGAPFLGTTPPPGGGAVTKTGVGTQVLTGLNTWTGTTLISAGTFEAKKTTALALGTGDITVSSGATLKITDHAGGGQLPYANNITVSGTGDAGTGAILFRNSAFFSMTGNIALAGDTTIVNDPANQNGGINFTGVISGGNALTFNGAGTGSGTSQITLSGTNTYTGVTNITGAGIVLVLVNGDQSAATGAVSVASGSTLGGSGTLGGATVISSGALHAPGDSLGVQTFTNGLTYSSGSIFAWDLATAPNDNAGGGVRGTDFDAVNANSLATTTGAIFRVVLAGSQNFTDTFWNTDHAWTDIFKTAAAGTPLAFQNIFSGGIQYYDSADSSGNNNLTGRSFTISGSTLNWTAVPEPSSTLAGLLLAAGLLRRRRA